MKAAVVMPVGPGREENMLEALASIYRQTVPVGGIVVVHDGIEAFTGPVEVPAEIPFTQIVTNKHVPGMEQPRNLGVRAVQRVMGDCDYVWFVDSDIVLAEEAHDEFLDAHDEILGTDVPRNRILVGPYEWLPEDVRPAVPNFWQYACSIQNDPRWPSFSQFEPDQVFIGDLSAGLACFSGNLMWPIDEFTRIGGFWNEIHHGRCEDGELGLRAVAQGVPISFARHARGFHLAHPVNMELAQERNARDVPMLNARHPWVEGEEIFVVERDGARFEQRCGDCGELVNTIEWWAHRESCGKEPAEHIVMPGPMP